MDTQAVPYQPGVLLGWEKVSVGVQKKFFFQTQKPEVNISHGRTRPLSDF